MSPARKRGMQGWHSAAPATLGEAMSAGLPRVASKAEKAETVGVDELGRAEMAELRLKREFGARMAGKVAGD